MDFYKVLQAIMDERDMTIPDIARASGLSDSTVRSIITRKSKTIALEVAAKLSNGLGISLEQLNDGVSSSITADLLTQEEYQIIKKYRTLDSAAQARIMNSLDFEYQSILKSEENSSSCPA